MLNRLVRSLNQIVDNPYLNFVVCLLLLFSAISETIHEFRKIHEFRFGVHHGIIPFAMLHILRVFPDIFEGLEYMDKASNAKEE